MKRPSQRGLSVLFERTRNEKLRICRFFIFNEIVGPSFISGLSLPPLRDPPSCPVTLDCGFLATPGFLSRKGPRLQTIHKFASHLESIRLRLFSSTARAAGLVEVARGLHQLAVQNGRSRSSPDGVVAENHVLVIEYRARPRPPDHGGHAVFGVQVELRLWPVLLFTQYDGMLGADGSSCTSGTAQYSRQAASKSATEALARSATETVSVCPSSTITRL